MATIDPTPLTQPRDSNYQAKLHESLHAIKKDYEQQIISSEAEIKRIKQITDTDSTIMLDSTSLVTDAFSDYEALREINDSIAQTDLQIKSVLAYSNYSAQYAKDTVANTALAAKAIDAAHVSVAKLTSFVASIRAKLNSEDRGSHLAALCEGAYESTQSAARAAEKSTVNILHATIEAANSNSSSIAAQIETVAQHSALLLDTFSKEMALAEQHTVTCFNDSLNERTKQSSNLVLSTAALEFHTTVTILGKGAEYSFLYPHTGVKHLKEIHREDRITSEIETNVQQRETALKNEKSTLAVENAILAKEKSVSNSVTLK